MEYSKLVDTYRKLGETQSTLEKTSILAELYSGSGEELEDIILLSMGRAFPSWKDLDLGISSKTMVDIISEATGKTEAEIENVWKDEGDLGSAAEGGGGGVRGAGHGGAPSALSRAQKEDGLQMTMRPLYL